MVEAGLVQRHGVVIVVVMMVVSSNSVVWSRRSRLCDADGVVFLLFRWVNIRVFTNSKLALLYEHKTGIFNLSLVRV
jgi:hypothetical protein